MDTASLPEYVAVELPLHHVKPALFLSLVQKAAAGLYWFSTAVNEDTVLCQAPGSEFDSGEIITITIKEKKAILYSKPVNQYYWDTALTGRNVQRLKLAITRAIEAHEKDDRNLHPMHREKWGALVPSKSYKATPLIVYANVLVFIAMVIAGLSPLHPTAQSLYEWGGNVSQAVVAGQWWRLGTYMFLHGGAMHLFMNMFAMLYIGMFLEPLMGKLRFVSAYLITGVFAGLLSIVMHSGSVGVGASGAIFGMYGVFFSVLTTTHIKKTLRTTMLRSILFFIVFNLMMGLQGNTDNAAHIGGLLSGIAIGYMYYPGIARHASAGRQVLTTAVLSAITILAIFTTVHFIG